MASKISEHDETLAAGLPAGEAGPAGGQLLAGRYELASMLGRGGMGCVYRVRDRELDEVVALKVLHRDLLASDGMLERFRQEVRLARRVTHKNVARTYDIGEHGGDRFLTMELVEGEPLASLLERSGALPVGEALRIAREMCAGMTAAHEAGVIHRDLKPENVCIARDGRVVLMDFGIARTHLPGSARQTSGKMLGTPGYMAPEQVQASDRIDARADVYAFGAVLYEMLTGEVAWPGESPIVVAAARLWSPPPDPRARRPELPAELAELVLRCMAREPEARFPSARELAAALDAVASPAPLSPSEARPVAAPAAAAAETTVAVLPFRNIGAADDAYLVEGLTEDLIDALSTTRGLRVRARASRTEGEAPDEIGRRLGVDVVVEGSMRRAGDTLRVSARLVGVQDGFQIWAQRFERPMEAALGLNDEVARAIAAALSREHRAPERAPVRDPVALELYFRARHQLNHFWNALSNLNEPMGMLRAALDRAPDDPTILAGYVAQRARLRFVTGEDQPELEEMARRALARTPHLGEPWYALASLRFNVQDDAAGAVRALKRAMLNAPSLPEAPDLAGRILVEAGAMDDADALLERALWLDPLQPWAHVDRMRIAALRGQLERMESLWPVQSGDVQASIQRGLSLQRFSMWWRAPQTGASHVVLPDTADERLRRMEEIRVRVTNAGTLEQADREFWADFATQPPPGSRARRLFGQLAAEFHAYVHDDDEALRYVASTVAEGLRDLPWMDLNPLLEPLRARPEWAELRGEVAARAESVLAAWRGPPATLDEL